MNPTRLLAAVLVTLALAATAGKARAQQLPISPLEWLVGGTWVAQGDDMPPNTLRIETQYRWAATGNFIQFTTQFIGKDGKPAGNYAGNFYYDPATKQLAMWYMDRNNAITQGSVGTSPMGMTITLAGSGEAPDASGPVDLEAVVTKTPGDTYRWTLAARKAGSNDRYKPLFMVDYVRKPG
jgi:hypothetical protein